MSQGMCSSSALLMFFIPGRPTTERVWFLCSSAASGSMPSSQCTPPVESLMAITRAPASVKSRAAIAPALPYP